MKIKLSAFCYQCLEEAGNTKQAYDTILAERPEMAGDYLCEVNDDGVYKIDCHKGHTTFVALQEQKFETLLDFAAMALIDGYTREAVSGIASAFERFFEFYISVICLKNKVNQNLFTKTWKAMRNQSERQLGAFMILSLLEGEEYVPDENRAAFRNKVIHQGRIPSAEETIDYGEYVLAFIFKVLKNLAKNYESELMQITGRHMISRVGKLKGARVATSAGPTIVNLFSVHHPDFGNISFRDALSRMSKSSYTRHRYSKEIDMHE